MATVWERIQEAARAALNAWRQPSGIGYSAGGISLDDLTTEQRKRVQEYEQYWKYYMGQFKRPLKVKPNNPDDNVIVNHCRRVVDKGVSFLFGKDLAWDVEGLTEEQIKKVDEVWGADRRMAFLSDVALNGGVCGTFYLQIMPPREGEDRPRLVNLTPGIVFPEWNPSDLDEVWAYQIRFRGQDGRMFRTIWSLDDGGHWQVWQEEQEAARRWVKTADPQEWPWPWCPIVSGKNLPNPNDFFGISDLADAGALNEVANFVASNINRIIRLYGHPVLWGYGFPSMSIQADPGKAILANSDKAHLQYLQMTSDLASSFSFFQRLGADLYKIARVPEMDPEVMHLGAQSGFALRVLYGDLLEKTETKRRLYGQVIEEVYKRLAEMMGFGDNVDVEFNWEDPLPLNQQDEIAGLGFDLGAGIASKETVAKKRGYDPEQEQERIREEQAAAVNLGELLLSKFNKGQGMPVGMQQGG